MTDATVYDVHREGGGCLELLPESLRLAAEEMLGQRLPLVEIVDRLQAAVDSGGFSIKDDYIGYGEGKQIYVPCASPGLIVWQHNWRVVRIER